MQRFKNIIYCLLLVLLSACNISSEGINGTEIATAEMIVSEDTEINLPDIQIEESNNPEVQRAVSYGLVPEEMQSAWDSRITFAEYAVLIRNVVKEYDASKLDEWDKNTAEGHKSYKFMIFGDAIFPAYYSASLLGYGAEPEGDWLKLSGGGSLTDWGWMDEISTWEIYSISSTPSPFKDHHNDVEPVGWDYTTAGYFWCLGQASHVDGMPVLRVPDDVLVEPLSREEAIALVARLYESLLAPVESETNEAAKAILADAESWKNNFFENQNDVQFSGTAHYVSNSGNDQNDGLTPETAWASLQRARSARLQPGDAILLERGGVWYSSSLPQISTWWDAAFILQKGVTLGAYGDGPRPLLRGDDPQASNPENWSLWFDEDGIRIWEYSREVQDTNVIVFNGGEQWADKIWPYWNGGEYLNRDGTLFDTATALDRDLTFVSLLKINGKPLDTDFGSSLISGPLYLRCDAGNPAEVYSEVIIPQMAVGISQLSDSVVDGLSIQYYTTMGTAMASYDGDRGMTIRNSEIAWSGGLIGNYQELSELVRMPHAAGGAVQFSGSELTASGNYFHDNGPMTFIISIHGEKPEKYVFENSIITGNLIERSGVAFHWADLTKMDHPGAEGFLSNIRFSDNLVLYSGYGWVDELVSQADKDHPYFYSAVEDGMGASRNDGILIENNTFYLSDLALITYTDQFLFAENGFVDTVPVFSGNIYAQHRYGFLAIWNGDLIALTDETVKSVLGDTTGKAIIIE